MNILVTGASGFIGRNFVRLCIEQGHTVRAVHRREILDDELVSLAASFPERIQFVRRDLSFSASMPDLKQPSFKDWIKEARQGIPKTAPDWPIADQDLAAAQSLCQGCDAVVHIAAFALDWGEFSRFFAANVNPFHVLSQACGSMASKPVMVLVSSIALHGFGRHVKTRESGPYYRAGNPYQISKRMAEAVAGRARSQGLQVGIVRPGNVYGPGDTTTFFPIFEALEKGIMGTVGGGKSLTCPIYIDDLCQALYLCTLELHKGNPKAQQAFNITSPGVHTWKTVVETCIQSLGLKSTYPNLPAFLAWPATFVLEGVFRILRIKAAPPLTFYRISQLLNHYDFDPALAQESLGWTPRTEFTQGMKLCADSWIAQRKNYKAR